MIRKIVVAGCRDYNNYEEAEKAINYYIRDIKEKYELIFLSGGCKGADKLGELYANKYGYPIEKVEAEWSKYGRAAGPKRNLAMAKSGDYIICFWDGKSKGTYSMIKAAKSLQKPLRIKYIVYRHNI